MPFHAEDDRLERWAIETLDELLTTYKNTGLVEIVPSVLLQKREEPDEYTENELVLTDSLEDILRPPWTRDRRINFQDVGINYLSWRNLKEKLRIPPEEELAEAGYTNAWFFRPPVVDAPKMLEHLLSEVKKSAVDVNVETNEYFESVEQMQDRAAKLGCDTVVNCTGLGAASICQDDQLVGARGIMLQFDRASCVRRKHVRQTRLYQYGRNFYDTVIMTEDEPWGSETMPCYLIPRGDLILVGGSYLEGDTEASIREEERERLILNAKKMGINVRKSKLVGEWTGFRPFRTTVRCELENDVNDDGGGDVQVFHSYGYGGSGWTVNVGAAKECADILLGTKPEPITKGAAHSLCNPKTLLLARVADFTIS